MQHPHHARPRPGERHVSGSTAAREGGYSTVELAAVLPVVALLMFAILDAGRGIVSFTELTNASRAGARVAIVNQSNDSGCASAERTFKCAIAEVGGGLGIAPAEVADVTITGSDCFVPSNCAATVTVDHEFEPITPVIGSIIGSIDLSVSTTMPIERTFVSP